MLLRLCRTSGCTVDHLGRMDGEEQQQVRHKREVMQNTLITLAHIHFEVGIIDYDELNERINVALWLSDEQEEFAKDPRSDPEENIEQNKSENDENEIVITTIKENKNKSSRNEDERAMGIICLGLWVFTKSDPDSYPSVPHGHFRSQNNKWPKLNPYTGRVFASKHQEDKKQRLSKKQMKVIWSDEKFKSFCREMIVWYQEAISMLCVSCAQTVAYA